MSTRQTRAGRTLQERARVLIALLLCQQQRVAVLFWHIRQLSQSVQNTGNILVSLTTVLGGECWDRETAQQTNGSECLSIPQACDRSAEKSLTQPHFLLCQTHLNAENMVHSMAVGFPLLPSASTAASSRGMEATHSLFLRSPSTSMKGADFCYGSHSFHVPASIEIENSCSQKKASTEFPQNDVRGSYGSHLMFSNKTNFLHGSLS